MSDLCWINDTDIADLGLDLMDGTEGQLSGLAWARQTVALPGNVGGEVSDVAEATPRMVRLRGKMNPASVTARSTELDTLSDALYGLLEIRFADNPDRRAEGWVRNTTVSEWVSSYVLTDLVATVEIQCDKPQRKDVTPSLIAFGSTAIEVPLGTLPSRGVIKIIGAATNPVLTYKDMAGTTQGSMTFTVALATDEYLSIDLDRRRIRKFDSGVETNALALMTAGDFFEIDPMYGSKSAGLWPTLSVSAGAGIIEYRREWST